MPKRDSNQPRKLIKFQSVVINPADIARDAIQIVTTAGLKKDVIDLLKEKIALLSEQIVTLQSEKSELESENANLQQNVEKLERVTPKRKFEPNAERFLEYLFGKAEEEGISVERIAKQLGISKSLAEYQCNALIDAEMLEWAGSGGIILSAKGITYCVEVLDKK